MFEGSIVALVTPFKEGKVDEESFLNLIDFQVAGGTQGILISGTTGESATLSDNEKERLFKLTVERLRGKIPFIAGTGTNDTKTTLHLSQKAQEIGADGLLVITPYYNKPTQQGLIEHFSYIAKRISIPIIIYNVPGRTGVSIEPSTLAELAKIKNIIGVKEATGSMKQATEINLLCPDDFIMLSGDDFTYLPFLAAGGRGIISVSANIIPDKMQKIYSEFKEGRISEARTLHNEVFDLHKMMFMETNPIPVKTALALMNKIKPEFRLPLCQMKEENKNKLVEELKKHKLI
ncbi:MAG TPA: 4-hydroxy-tetrahydrodipicolinate synthase [Firmicutes bacterium]|nr:4-hydroxy-tetrahydrodipicolinate synthase [Bacillota bacterium]